LSIQSAEACTVFVLDDGPRHYYGSNYDWHLGIGYVMVNPAGLTKQSWVVDQDPGRPLHWQAKFGSLTFVQYGQGSPKGGMNEAGLVIEGLMLHATEYPPPDDRPYIGSTGQTKQYLLDTCATVADAVAQLSRVRLAKAYSWTPGIHFMMADARGDCAVVEFLGGRTVIHRDRNLPVKVLTNHPYPTSVKGSTVSQDIEFGYAGSSRSRFAMAADRLETYRSVPSKQAVAYAMETLTKVSSGSYTQWSVVYDQTERITYWRSSPDENLRWIDLTKIDFDCRKPRRAIPVQRGISGEANDQLSLYTLKDNRALVYQALSRSSDIIPVPKEIWDDVWRWPEKEMCTKADGATR
jgi:choloylglycine hydrolase